MRDYKVVTLVVQDGKVVNLQVFDLESDGINHANYCLNCYGDEKGTTQIVSFKHHNDGIVEVICDLSDMIKEKR